MRGFQQHVKRQNIIYVNSDLDGQQQNLVCGHEMGHCFLHHGLNRIFMNLNTQFVAQKLEIDLDSAQEWMESSLRASDRQIELDKEEVGDTLYGTEYSNDWFIHSKILLINSESMQKQNGTGTNRAIEELRDDLAEFLNE